MKFPLYEWQKEAIENFLINENSRERKIKNGEILPPNHLMFNMATGSGKTLVMAALILYYYAEKKITNFIFFVNQNAILGKTQDNFVHKNHTKYLFKENIIIDEKRVNIREVEMFSNSTDDIQIKFTTIQKLHNDIYRESENSLLLSDLKKRNLVLIGDEAHHLNASTTKKRAGGSTGVGGEASPTVATTSKDEFSDISFLGELKDSTKDDDIERSWETTVCHHILNKGKNSFDSQNKNVLLEFTATVPETPEIQAKYENKIIIKFGLKEFVNAGCTKHIRLVRSNLSKNERILQALVLNWYRFEIALKHEIPNVKPVILFRSKTIEDSKQDYLDFLNPLPISLIFSDGKNFENENSAELFKMTKQFFLYAERELEKYDHPFKATDFQSHLSKSRKIMFCNDSNNEMKNKFSENFAETLKNQNK